MVTLRRAVAVIVVTIAVSAPIVESFDRWDDTLATGNDIEGACVVLALCAGVALTAAAARKSSRPPLTVTTCSVMPAAAVRHGDLLLRPAVVNSSPPGGHLRI